MGGKTFLAASTSSMFQSVRCKAWPAFNKSEISKNFEEILIPQNYYLLLNPLHKLQIAAIVSLIWSFNFNFLSIQAIWAKNESRTLHVLLGVSKAECITTIGLHLSLWHPKHFLLDRKQTILLHSLSVPIHLNNGSKPKTPFGSGPFSFLLPLHPRNPFALSLYASTQTEYKLNAEIPVGFDICRKDGVCDSLGPQGTKRHLRTNKIMGGRRRRTWRRLNTLKSWFSMSKSKSKKRIPVVMFCWLLPD